MTKREALHMAIKSLQENSTGKMAQDAISKLEQIETEICRQKWTQQTIIESFNRWAQTHGSPPIVADLTADDLPSKFIVERVFGEHASVVLNRLYPRRCTRIYCERKYSGFTNEQLIEFYKEQISELNPKSGRDYNHRRMPGSPTWEFAAKRLNSLTWDDFYFKVTGKALTYKPNQECKVLKVELNSPLVSALKNITESTKKGD